MRVYVIHHAPGDTVGPDLETLARRRVRSGISAILARGRLRSGIIINITSAWSMDRVCRRVRSMSRCRVGLLYLLCHGNMGQVFLGQGLTAASASNFEILRGCWVGNYPRIEVHACLVSSATPTVCQPSANVSPAQMASGACDIRGEHAGVEICCSGGTRGENAPGHALMQALADAAGVLVIAAIDPQLTDANFQFEGPIRHYRPAEYYHRPEPIIRDMKL